MARTPEQRGPFGRWLVRERKARGWTADEMRTRLQEARGFAMAHSTYALLESGQRQPTEEQARHLTAFLGSAPEPDQPAAAPAPDTARLIAAMTTLTEAMTRRATDDERLDRLERHIERLGEAVLKLTERMTAWEESGGTTGAPPGGPGGRQRSGGGPKTHADAR